MVLKIDMFKSTATCSGLAKVAASHFRTFLDGHKKCRHQLKIVQIDQRVGYVFWHSFIFELSKVIIDTAPGPQYSDYCDTIFYVLHLTKESSVPYG